MNSKKKYDEEEDFYYDIPLIMDILKMEPENIDPVVTGMSKTDPLKAPPYIVDVEMSVTSSSSTFPDVKDIEPNTESLNISKNLINKAKQDLALFEVVLRKFIKTQLINIYKERWWEDGIPENIKQKVIKNIKTATEHQDPRAEFDNTSYMDYSDYFSIIMNRKNWENSFSKIFFDKENLNFPFDRLRVFRNACLHERMIQDEFNKYLIFMDEILKFLTKDTPGYEKFSRGIETLQKEKRNKE